MDTRIMEQQIKAQLRKTVELNHLTLSQQLAFAVTGLNEEAGEVAGLLCRETYKHRELSVDKWLEELGDCLWYLIAATTTRGLTLDDLFLYNTRKLQVRYGDKFD